MKQTFRLSDLDCAMCARKIETAVRKVDGVTDAQVNFVLQKLTLEAEDAAFDDVLARVKTAVGKAERGCEVL